MNESLKVQPHHLERGAYLYVRQSSMRQVIENIESTKRQYALRGRAVALGWRDDQIIVTMAPDPAVAVGWCIRSAYTPPAPKVAWRVPRMDSRYHSPSGTDVSWRRM
jgi:hypothetical protein